MLGGILVNMRVEGIGSYTISRFRAGYPALRAMRARQGAHQRQAAAARQNAANAVSYARTRDSWLQGIHNSLGQMSALAVRANDGTLNPADRANIQQQFSQLQQGIRQITSGPYAMGRFNGLYLFQG
jgi:flagellin